MNTHRNSMMDDIPKSLIFIGVIALGGLGIANVITHWNQQASVTDAASQEDKHVTNSGSPVNTPSTETTAAKGGEGEIKSEKNDVSHAGTSKSCPEGTSQTGGSCLKQFRTTTPLVDPAQNPAPNDVVLTTPPKTKVPSRTQAKKASPKVVASSPQTVPPKKAEEKSPGLSMDAMDRIMARSQRISQKYQDIRQ